MVISQSQVLKNLNKNTVVFLNFILSNNIYKLHYKIIENLVKNNHNILLVSCDSSIKYCNLNPFGFKAICKECENKSTLLADKLRISSISISALVNSNKCKINSDLIEGVNSSIISLLRKSNLDSETYFIKNFLKSSSKIYNGFTHLFQIKKIDNIFLFNGRFNCGRSVILAAESQSVDYFTYDNKKGEFPFLVSNGTVHNIDENIKILNLIGNYDVDRDVYKSFAKRVNHLPSFEKVYTKNQISGYFDKKFIVPEHKKIVTFFLGSEDEFSSLGKLWGGRQYFSQIDFIKIFASKIDNNKICFVVRMHPNQANCNSEELKKIIKSLKLINNIILIYPTTKVDSYELVKKSLIVISSMSFIGVESILLGTPSFFISKCLYSEYISNTNLMDVDDIISAITSNRISIDSNQLMKAKKIYYFFAFLRSDIFLNIDKVHAPTTKMYTLFYFFKIINRLLLWIKLKI